MTKVRTRCITLARVYSMSMAVTLHRASWNKGMVSCHPRVAGITQGPRARSSQFLPVMNGVRLHFACILCSLSWKFTSGAFPTLYHDTLSQQIQTNFWAARGLLLGMLCWSVICFTRGSQTSKPIDEIPTLVPWPGIESQNNPHLFIMLTCVDSTPMISQWISPKD